jgi:D-sedoheptulose 7-phosphate isomerase
VLFGGGEDGGPAAAHADHALVVPSSSTARIQELHVLFLHLVIEHVDAWAAGE